MYNAKLVETHKVVQGLSPTTPSTSTPDYVCLKNYSRMTAIIHVKNGTVVTGSAITLKQATAVANTGEKALAFAYVHADTDAGAADALTETAVTSNTFTTSTTNSKDLVYVIDVDPATLDVANGFDCVRVGTADAANTVLSVMYILRAKYQKATPPTAITD